MRSLSLVGGTVRWSGCIDLEPLNGGVTPWRGMLGDRALYAPELAERMKTPAGVRIVFRSDTTRLALKLSQSCVDVDPAHFDLVVDGQRHQRLTLHEGDTALDFENLPEGSHLLEIYLPVFGCVQVADLSIDDGATAESYDDPRPKWITHGSSITMCRGAGFPTATWPAIVAAKLGLNHTNLGYGGQCKLETLVARCIANQPADMISVCLGINVYPGDLSQRTFRSAAAGFLLTIRDGHPETPLVVCSPIYCRDHETIAGPTGMTLRQMREDLAGLVDDLRVRGDSHIHYVDGLSLMGAEHDHLMPDHVHPNREGYAVLAENFIEQAAPQLGCSAANTVS